MFLRPDYNLKNIYEINLEELKNKGIKAIFFDLDSTIMVSKSAAFTDEVKNWLKTVEENFFIAVISNNTKDEYLDKVRSISNFLVIGNAQKPSTKIINQILNQTGFKPKEMAFVGDRPLTDILAGKRIGATTILVDSINAKEEGKPTRLVRWLERRFILN